MGYLDIIKRSFRVANGNLAAILAQIIYVIAIFLMLAVMAVVLVAMFAGTFAGIGKAGLTPENLLNLASSSVGIIFVGVLFLFVFLTAAGILNALVQAGIIGCLIDTARGNAGGFSVKSFFSSMWHSGMRLFWLQVLIFVAGIGGFILLISAGVIGFAAVLMPLKDSGSQVAAFALGVPFIVVLILLFLVFAFLLYGGSMLSQVSLVAGGRGAFAAAGDAYDFLRGRFWDAMLFTLMVVFIVICANVVIEVISLPFNLMSDKSALGALAFLPLLFVAMLIKMYVAIFGLSCFVVYYLSFAPGQAAQPGQPAQPVQPAQPDAQSSGEEIVDAELIGPEQPGMEAGQGRMGEGRPTGTESSDRPGGQV